MYAGTLFFPAIPMSGRWRWDQHCQDREFKASLSCMRPCLKNKPKNKATVSHSALSKLISYEGLLGRKKVFSGKKKIFPKGT